jgi:signal transduction histidine kinase
MLSEGFWDEPEQAQKIVQRVAALRERVNVFKDLARDYEDLDVLVELGEEEQDQDTANEVRDGLASISRRVSELELAVLLGGPYDRGNAIMSLHAGAGGTEAQDWVEMLLRMYMRWAERRRFKVELLDLLPGDEAGTKSATIEITGRNAYGYLRSEKGVHRLVRISPFDTAGRRHTSFASVDVLPEVDDKYRKLLEDIKSCGQRSKRVIQNLLTFSRQDSYTFAEVSINDVVENSLYLVSYQIEKNKISINKNFSPRIPPLMGNRLQLEQVVINFLLNARDALEGLSNGVIEISTNMREDAEAGCTVVEVKVTDNGTGIPESIIDQIFNPFFTTKEKTRGTGLGLSVSLGIAQTHGGRIEVESEAGRGSVFSLIIPI